MTPRVRRWLWLLSGKDLVSDGMNKAQDQLKAVPVRRRSAARLAAIQITYQALITGQSAADFVPQFLSHYAAEVSKSFCVKDLIDTGGTKMIECRRKIHPALRIRRQNGDYCAGFGQCRTALLRC